MPANPSSRIDRRAFFARSAAMAAAAAAVTPFHALVARADQGAIGTAASADAVPTTGRWRR